MTPAIPLQTYPRRMHICANEPRSLKRKVTGKEVWSVCRRRRCAQPEMQIRMTCHHPPARGAQEKALLNQKGLQHVLDGAALFADGGGQAVAAHRPAGELIDEGEQQLAVHHVETFAVDVEHVLRLLRRVRDYAEVNADGRICGTV